MNVCVNVSVCVCATFHVSILDEVCRCWSLHIVYDTVHNNFCVTTINLCIFHIIVNSL